MNIWNEKYPTDLKILIKDCDAKMEELEKQLSHSTSPFLKELYYSKNNKNVRNTERFDNLEWKPNNEKELKGIYVFGEVKDGMVVPVYVGISRTIYRRLRQHGWGKAHNDATFAFLQAIHHHAKYMGQRKDFPFKKVLKHQESVRNYKVAILPIENDYDLYFLEVYAAGKWKTAWNSFKTH